MIRESLAFAGLMLKDGLRMRPRVSVPEDHLAAAEDWLVRAHGRGGDDGVSYGYSARGGWRPSYPETSGYIACTFFDLARARGNAAYRERALRIAAWLLTVQNADGSFANPRYGDEGIVFDSGQCLFGLLRAHEESAQPRFLDAALRVGAWLVQVAGGDGRWTRCEHLNTAHVYNTRTAWALLKLNQHGPDAARVDVARSNLDWALAEQQAGGLFEHCAFVRGEPPFTHTLAYTAEGLLGAGGVLHSDSYIQAAARCVDAVLPHIRPDGFLPGRLTVGGRAAASYCCLTGNSQFAICCARLHALTGDERYRAATIRLLDYVIAQQDIDTPNADTRGGIKGSQPVWGRYAPLTFPNWAAKFFVDAMWLRREWAV